jgi:cytochrome d ubiquinol oxidase subunit I
VLDVLTLSRLQFALTAMFHYLFPPLTIGLGLMMVVVEAMYLKTGDPRYLRIARFWTRLFAVNFAMGVATGIVMEFEFGTNWATYSRFVGDVFGSALAAEGIFAFFLESGFLAVVVFGWERVSKRVHFFSTCMMSLGSIFSSIWIVVANSWQQTPAGFHIVGEGLNARAQITDFWAMVFNPSSVDNLVHVWFGAFILGSFFVMSVAAWYLLRSEHLDLAPLMFKIGLVVAVLSSFGMLVSGDFVGRMIAERQPAKLAAMEGVFHTDKGGTAMYVIGLPDEATEQVRFGIAIPKLLSFLVYHQFDRPVPGLDQIAVGDRPPVFIPFAAYHVMIGLGTAFVGVTVLAVFFWWRGTLFDQRWLMRIFVVAVLGPYAANEAGWISTEVGRQPWIVYGLLRTPAALSRAVRADMVLGSIVMFATIYLLLFAVWVFVLNDKIRHGPETEVGVEPEGGTSGLLDVAAGGSLTSVAASEEGDG